jgi:hypothetical protein
VTTQVGTHNGYVALERPGIQMPSATGYIALMKPIVEIATMDAYMVLHPAPAAGGGRRRTLQLS